MDKQNMAYTHSRTSFSHTKERYMPAITCINLKNIYTCDPMYRGDTKKGQIHRGESRTEVTKGWGARNGRCVSWV